MSTLEADGPARRKIKKEIKSERDENGRETPTDVSSMDFNRLYGDLYQKLLNTPVQDIFQQNLSPRNVKGNRGVPNDVPVYPFSPNGRPLPPDVLKMAQMHDGMFEHGMTSPMTQGEFDPYRYMNPPGSADQDDMEKIASRHEFIDIPRLVEDFRISLERFGVSQRFAARFIMQDTSQGNLSFLMEKGKTKGWEELSVRGRIPYIKMKAWLESKDQQILTLEMIKRSQEIKNNSPREPYSRRERFSMFHLQVLCQLFEENQNPPMNTRSAVAQSLNIPLDRVNVWFQNQRARGFPAKKILQNSLYNDGVGVEKVDMGAVGVGKGRYSPSDNLSKGEYSVKETKPRNLVKENSYLPLDIPPSGDPFALLQNFTSSKFGSLEPTKREKTKVTTPLLSASSLMASNISGFNMALPVATQPALHQAPHLDFKSFPFVNDDVESGRQSTPGCSDSNQNLHKRVVNAEDSRETDRPTEKILESSQDALPQSGAAKRKRGKRPQQIVRVASPIQPEEWRTDEDGVTSQNKRTKREQSNSDAELNEDDSARDTKHSFERERNSSAGNDHIRSHSARESTGNQNTDVRDVMATLSNENTDSTIVAIKSVYAHLLMAEKENEKVKFEEPDLD